MNSTRTLPVAIAVILSGNAVVTPRIVHAADLERIEVLEGPQDVPGTFVRQSIDAGIHYAAYTNNIPRPATPVNSANNSSLVAYPHQGVRLL